MHVVGTDEQPETAQHCLLAQEQRTLHSHHLNEIMAARDKIKVADPDCHLVQLVDAKLARLGAEAAPTSPWAA
mgnify:CR=1 FL=1